MMQKQILLSMAGKLTIVGLVAAAAGILIQVLSGVEWDSSLRSGLILSLVAAGVVAWGPWRWTPIIGVLLALWITFGAFVTPGTADRLSQPAELDPFLGTAVQMLGLITAIIAGVVATTHNYRTETPAINR